MIYPLVNLSCSVGGMYATTIAGGQVASCCLCHTDEGASTKYQLVLQCPVSPDMDSNEKVALLLTHKVVSALQTIVSTGADQSYSMQLINYLTSAGDCGTVHLSGHSKYLASQYLHSCM